MYYIDIKYCKIRTSAAAEANYNRPFVGTPQRPYTPRRVLIIVSNLRCDHVTATGLFNVPIAVCVFCLCRVQCTAR